MEKSRPQEKTVDIMLGLNREMNRVETVDPKMEKSRPQEKQ